MARAMMALGPVVFGVATLPASRYRRENRYEWTAQYPVGGSPRRAFAGLGDDVLTIDIDLAPGHGSHLALDALRVLAARGAPHILADRRGRVYGWFAVRRLNENVRRIGGDGSRERTVARLELARTDSGLIDAARSAFGAVVRRLGS